VGRDRSRVPSFVLILPSAPVVSGCSPSLQILANRWAGFGAQCPVQRERLHSRDGHDKDFQLAQGALRLRLDEGEMLSARQLLLTPALLESDRDQKSKGGRGCEPVRNMLRKTTGRARLPDPGDRPHRAVS